MTSLQFLNIESANCSIIIMRKILYLILLLSILAGVIIKRGLILYTQSIVSFNAHEDTKFF